MRTDRAVRRGGGPRAPGRRGWRRASAGADRRLSPGRRAASSRPRHRRRRAMVLRSDHGAAADVGADAGSSVRQHRGSPAAACLGGRARIVAARGGAAERSRRELGQPAAAIAVGTARCGAGRGARRPVVELGGEPGDRPIGARQPRACRAAAGDAGDIAAVVAGAMVLVRALPADPARLSRTHGRPTAPVHRHPGRQHGVARRRAAAGRPRGRMHRRSALPGSGDRAAAQACRHAVPVAGAPGRGGAAPTRGDRRLDQRT